jgi:hypothetical protein
MAKPHTPDHGPTNPDVKFERSDIEPGTILNYGLIFAALVGFAAAFILFIVPRLMRWYEPEKRTDLPPVAAGAVEPEPEPRLEAIEDLEKRKPKLLPPRASDYLRGQRGELTGEGKALPIEDTIKALAGKLPAGKQETPLGFTVRLPSKAAAGRVETGGR